MQCYKKIIDKLFDRSTTWSGYDAKWFDECIQSTPSEVDIRTWDYKDPSQDETSGGTVDPESISYCKYLPGFSASRTSNPTQSFFFGGAY